MFASLDLWRLTETTFIKSSYHPTFKNSFFHQPRVQVERGLPKYNLERFVIPIPPLAEQKRIVNEIERQFLKTKKLKEHIVRNQDATEQLLQALLHNAFEVETFEEAY